MTFRDGTRRLGFALLLGVGIAGVRVPSSQACSRLGNDTLQIVDEGRAGEAPGPVTEVEVARVVRGNGPTSLGCGEEMSDSCDDGGVIVLTLTPAVDADSPREQVGYRLAVSSGTPPPIPIFDPEFPDDVAFLPREDEGEARLELYWTDGSTDEQEPIRFELTLTPVDAEGHEGPTSPPVLVDHPGS